jgi:hypothetical protein
MFTLARCRPCSMSARSATVAPSRVTVSMSRAWVRLEASLEALGPKLTASSSRVMSGTSNYGNGYLYLPGRIPADRTTLIQRDLDGGDLHRT